MLFILNKFGWFGLSIACLLFGLMDLATNVSIFIMALERVRQTPDLGSKFLLILSAIGIWSCLFLISGLIQRKRGSLHSFFSRQMFVMIIYIGIGVSLLINYYLMGDHTIDMKKAIPFLGCAPFLLISYSNIMFSPYIDIEDKKPPPPAHAAGTCSCSRKKKKCRKNMQKKST